MTTILQTGSEALLTYPAGDCDTVQIVGLTQAMAVVRLPNGHLYETVVEDIGIGVDDEIIAVFDDGGAWPPAMAPELAGCVEGGRHHPAIVNEHDDCACTRCGERLLLPGTAGWSPDYVYGSEGPDAAAEAYRSQRQGIRDPLATPRTRAES